MLIRVRKTLLEKCKITPREPVVAGVSGGPDSFCLLHLLHSLDYEVIVAHLDHQLRPGSAEEAKQVERLAALWDQKFVGARLDIGSFSRERRISIEEGARLARYQFLFKVAEENNLQAVIVGHTADDQVETMLMHLLRGSGINGLAGMSYHSQPNTWSNKIPLVRPLLDVWRQEIWEYLQEHGLSPSIDLSNLDKRIYRNRLRHELIPFLETYNPRIRHLLWQTADILGKEDETLQKVLDAAWRAVVQDQNQTTIVFNHLALNEQPVALQRRIIRKAIQAIHPTVRDLNFLTIERALNLIKQDPPITQIELIADINFKMDGERVLLSSRASLDMDGGWPQIPVGTSFKLQIPAEVHLAGGWLLRAEYLERPQGFSDEFRKNPDPYQAWLDYDLLELPLSIRTRLPGDRFQPLGMPAGSIKISDFMINEKLPEPARRNWPLVSSFSRIAWVPGFRIAHAYRITGETTQIAHLQLIQVEKT